MEKYLLNNEEIKLIEILENNLKGYKIIDIEILLEQINTIVNISNARYITHSKLCKNNITLMDFEIYYKNSFYYIYFVITQDKIRSIGLQSYNNGGLSENENNRNEIKSKLNRLCLTKCNINCIENHLKDYLQVEKVKLKDYKYYDDKIVLNLYIKSFNNYELKITLDKNEKFIDYSLT